MKNMTKRSYAMLTFAVITVATIGVAFKSSGKNQPELPMQSVGFKIATENASSQELPISGFVRGEKRAEIAPMASGRIIRIFKHEGESVKKGEILATLDAQQSNAQVNSANASVQALEKTLADSSKYYDQTVDQAKESGADRESIQTAKRGRDLQIQATKDQLVAAQGALQIAKAGQGNFTLAAPFSGIISNIYTREGDFANFSMPIVSLSTSNGLEIETYVSSSDAKLLSLGLIANFKTKEGAIINGVVTAVAPGSDSSNFKTLIRLHLNNEADAVKLGDFLEGKLLIPSQEISISIPKKSIVNRGGTLIVFTLDENNISHENIIETKNENNGNIEIAKGISAGQKIVVEGQQYLKEGSTAKPYESK